MALVIDRSKDAKVPSDFILIAFFLSFQILRHHVQIELKDIKKISLSASCMLLKYFVDVVQPDKAKYESI